MSRMSYWSLYSGGINTHIQNLQLISVLFQPKTERGFSNTAKLSPALWLYLPIDGLLTNRLNYQVCFSPVPFQSYLWHQ